MNWDLKGLGYALVLLGLTVIGLTLASPAHGTVTEDAPLTLAEQAFLANPPPGYVGYKIGHFAYEIEGYNFLCIVDPKYQNAVVECFHAGDIARSFANPVPAHVPFGQGI